MMALEMAISRMARHRCSLLEVTQLPLRREYVSTCVSPIYNERIIIVDPSGMEVPDKVDEH